MPIISEPLGRVLGDRYRLVAALGSGASAHVFLAEDMVLQRRVAVKVLQPALARDDAFLRRFRAEARSVAALNHPHVLRVFDWGEGEDGPYLVLESLEGGSLFDMLARGRRLSPGQAARIGAQAADGLAYAHARGIVHRDVKPANILFDEDGRARVADFGVARALSSASTTDPGTLLGTARYASPEQAQGVQLDGRSDVYSLGLVLYEAVTGKVPFSGDTPHATLQARIGGKLPHDPALGRLGSALAAACAPEHEDRPNAARFAERLERLADDLAAGGPLPLVRRGPVDDAEPGDLTLAGPIAGAALVGAAAAGAAAAGAGAAGAAATTATGAAGRAGTLGATDALDALSATGTLGATDATGTLGAIGTARGPGDATTNGAGLADSGEPTATIKVGDGPPPGASVRAMHRRRPPRRWPWIVAVVILVACIVAGVGVYLSRSSLFKAKHVVPEVVGDTMAAARRALRADHFKVKVDAAVTSTKYAAGDVVRQTPGHGVTLQEGSTIQIVPSSGEPMVAVPQLSSTIDCSIARQLLSERHLHSRCPALSVYSKTVPKGNIINWSYNGKLDPTTAPYGATILVAVSEGRQPVQLPSFANQTYTQAAQTLSADGLSVKEAQAYSTTIGAGRVISTTPPAGATVTVPSSITVTVSQGPSEVTVPTVIGDTVGKATAAIEAAHLTVGQVYGPKTGVVFTTDPLHGQKEKVGTPVILYTEPQPKTGPGPNPGSGTTTPPSG